MEGRGEGKGVASWSDADLEPLSLPALRDFSGGFGLTVAEGAAQIPFMPDHPSPGCSL
jgi:hypothetical protein